MAGDFFDVFSAATPDAEERGVDLPMPGAEKGHSNKLEVSVKYGVFELGPRGNVELERIMTDCANGKALLGWEKTHFTQDGDAIVTIKYLVQDKKKTHKMEGEEKN